MKKGKDLPEVDPLARKLGIREGMQRLILNAPKPYFGFFRDLPHGEDISGTGPEKAGFIHLFATSFEELEKGLEMAVGKLKSDGMLWVSWPKKASGVPSEIGKMEVLRAGQAIGLVDIKVAALDNVWSGHKFVIPLARRQGPATV